MKDCLYYTVSYVNEAGHNTDLVDYHAASFLNCTTTEVYHVFSNHELKIKHPRLIHVRVDDTFTESWDIKSAKCKIERWVNIEDYNGLFQSDWDIIFQNNLSERLPLIQAPDKILVSVCGHNRSPIPNALNLRYCSSVFYFPVLHYDVFREWTYRLEKGMTQEEVVMNHILRKQAHNDKVRCLPKYAWFTKMNGLDYYDFLHFGLDRKKSIKGYYTKKWGTLPSI